MELKAISAAEMLARVLYRDGLMLVVDKPAGVPVHRGPKGGGCLEERFDALRFGLPRPPSLAHRLDKDTSGCLVLGRHRKALAHLGLLFKHGKVEKTYWAVVKGGPPAAEGTIDMALGRRDVARGWWMKPDPAGQNAVTEYRVLGRTAAPGAQGTGAGETGTGTRPAPAAAPGADPDLDLNLDLNLNLNLTWLALRPLTGRTHQLRVHCAASGFPIVGDAVYGSAPRFGPPQMLHAREIVVPLSKNSPPVRVTAPAPAHMRVALRACGWTGEDGDEASLRAAPP